MLLCHKKTIRINFAVLWLLVVLSAPATAELAGGDSSRDYVDMVDPYIMSARSPTRIGERGQFFNHIKWEMTNQ